MKMLREGLDGARIPSGCAVSAIFSKSGERRSGEDIIKSIALMHDRSNGLGGGLGSLLAGQVLDRWGVDRMLLFCAALCAAGALLAGLSLRRPKAA